jgi:hypothetical protein
MLTPYQNVIEKLKNLLTFEECSQLKTRSKRTEEGRQKYFKTNALVPKTAVIRNEEGATAASPRSLFYRKDP